MGEGADFACSCTMPLCTLMLSSTLGKRMGLSGSWDTAGSARLRYKVGQQFQNQILVQLTKDACRNPGVQQLPYFAQVHNQHTLPVHETVDMGES